jgi:hypothetical protein
VYDIWYKNEVAIIGNLLPTKEGLGVACCGRGGGGRGGEADTTYCRIYNIYKECLIVTDRKPTIKR